MKAIRIRGTVIGSGIQYKKKVIDIPESHKDKIKNAKRGEVFYIKIRKRHYKQSGFKVVIYRADRYEYYHREPKPAQLHAIRRNEAII